MIEKVQPEKEKGQIKEKFVKVTIVDGATSLMQCGGGNLCNESK